ncbi:MAG: Uma2 family endonuclease [Gammaproteobacteria bacterium]
MSEPALKRLTFDDVEKLEDRDGLRYELWDGEPVAMTVGTPAHNLIALGLRDVIKPQLEPACRVFVADVGLRLGESQHSNKAYPDVMVVYNPKPETYQSNAVLVAEVLSDNSVSRDRNKKFKAYAAQGAVQTYLILSQSAVEIEVYRRANAWTEEIYRGAESIIELPHPALRLPLREIYAGVWEEPTGRKLG